MHGSHCIDGVISPAPTDRLLKIGLFLILHMCVYLCVYVCLCVCLGAQGGQQRDCEIPLELAL